MIGKISRETFAYYWRLFCVLTWTNFKLRYYGSVLGYVWSLLQPLALFAVLYLVFTVVWNIDTPHYKLFLLLGVMMWGFFLQGTTEGLKGFIANYQMIRKVSLPRIILVAASVSSCFVALLFNMVIFVVFALFEGVDWHPRLIWFFPLLASLYMLGLGISFILSIIVVRVRDMINIWEVAMNLGFWVTPVMYPMSKVPEEYRFFLFINPLSGILEYSRYFLVGIGGVTHVGYIYVIGISLAVFATGILFFQWKQAEMVEDL